jgi:hypothetical protein
MPKFGVLVFTKKKSFPLKTLPSPSRLPLPLARAPDQISRRLQSWNAESRSAEGHALASDLRPARPKANRKMQQVVSRGPNPSAPILHPLSWLNPACTLLCSTWNPRASDPSAPSSRRGDWFRRGTVRRRR